MSSIGKICHTQRVYSIKNTIDENHGLKLSALIKNTFKYANLNEAQAKGIINVATRLQKRLNRGELTQEKFVEYKNVLVESKIPFDKALKYVKYLFVAATHREISSSGNKLNYFNHTFITTTLQTIIDDLTMRIKLNFKDDVILPENTSVITQTDDENIDLELSSFFKGKNFGPMQVWQDTYDALKLKSKDELSQESSENIVNAFRHCLELMEKNEKNPKNVDFEMEILQHFLKIPQNDFVHPITFEKYTLTLLNRSRIPEFLLVLKKAPSELLSDRTYVLNALTRTVEMEASYSEEGFSSKVVHNHNNINTFSTHIDDYKNYLEGVNFDLFKEFAFHLISRTPKPFSEKKYFYKKSSIRPKNVIHNFEQFFALIKDVIMPRFISNSNAEEITQFLEFMIFNKEYILAREFVDKIIKSQKLNADDLADIIKIISLVPVRFPNPEQKNQITQLEDK